MSLWVDVKFANMISFRLRNFKRKNEYLWNASCPYCNDSATNKTKARLYIYKVKTGLFVKCHKCGVSVTLGNLINHLDSNLYKEYVLETYKESGASRAPAPKKVEVAIPDMFRTSTAITYPEEAQQDPPSNSMLNSLKRLDLLSDEHPAVKYVRKRQIPKDKWHLLYFCTRFKHYVNSLIPRKISDQVLEHPRLIIPYFNKKGEFFAFQGRAFGKEDPKYITIKLNEGEEKIFGLERLDLSKKVYIVEGPIDSLFIPNAIAVSGSSFNSPAFKSLASKSTIVYDNEPRSPTLTKLIKTTIGQGYSVCLWPDTADFKDINEAVQDGYDVPELVEMIDYNTYSGIQASLRFASWKKC